VIKRIISRERKEWIVISSDREIMSHAWACGSIPLPSSEFQSILDKSIRFMAGEYDPLEEEYDEGLQRKGNPRQPSKKEKALLRALNKL
jgi:hypothetical protein